MTEDSDGWPHGERRKDDALRESVEQLLQHVRETHSRMKAMSDPEAKRVQSGFLWHAHVIWDRLLAERKRPEGADSLEQQ